MEISIFVQCNLQKNRKVLFIHKPFTNDNPSWEQIG